MVVAMKYGQFITARSCRRAFKDVGQVDVFDLDANPDLQRHVSLSPMAPP